MLTLWEDGTNDGYHYAYQDLAPIGRDQSAVASLSEENRLKNRYGNIVVKTAFA